MSPHQRALIANADRWGRTPDRSAATEPARRAMAAKFEREVRDEFPDATDAQVAAMAEQRKLAYYRRLSAKAAAARAANRAARTSRRSA